MSLSAGLGPQQRGRVLADQPLVLGIDDHLDDGLAVAQRDLADVADLTPATRTVWPWPGVTAWAVESSALEPQRRLLDHGKRSRCSSRM